MKNSTILDILNGFKGHIDTIKTPAEHFKNLEAVCSTYNELKRNLTPELLILLQKYEEAITTSQCDAIDLFYTEGFKLGLHIGIENANH